MGVLRKIQFLCNKLIRVQHTCSVVQPGSCQLPPSVQQQQLLNYKLYFFITPTFIATHLLPNLTTIYTSLQLLLLLLLLLQPSSRPAARAGCSTHPPFASMWPPSLLHLLQLPYCNLLPATSPLFFLFFFFFFFWFFFPFFFGGLAIYIAKFLYYK